MQTRPTICEDAPPPLSDRPTYNVFININRALDVNRDLQKVERFSTSAMLRVGYALHQRSEICLIFFQSSS
jgi:hypothetical protein